MPKFYLLVLYLFLALFLGILIGIHIQQGRHESAHNNDGIIHVEKRQLNSQLVMDTLRVSLE